MANNETLSKGKKHRKRTVTCSNCGNAGHNVRTCRVGKSDSLTKGVSEPVLESSADIPAPPITGRKTKVDMRHEQSKRRLRDRPSPTADKGSMASGAPYRCKKCNEVAILVLVRVKDVVESRRMQKDVYKSDLRCERCMNKPVPSDLILKWGARPDETIEPSELNNE